MLAVREEGRRGRRGSEAEAAQNDEGLTRAPPEGGALVLSDHPALASGLSLALNPRLCFLIKACQTVPAPHVRPRDSLELQLVIAA
jgi:hypothetical protein